MTKDNRPRKSSDDEDNPPGPEHENALTISDNADVEDENRLRKIFGGGKGGFRELLGHRFPMAGEVVSGFVCPSVFCARHLSPEPLSAPLCACLHVSGQRPIPRSVPLPKLLQNSGTARGLVRQVLLGDRPLNSHQSAAEDALSELIKSAGSLKKAGKNRPYAFVNGKSAGYFIETPRVTRRIV